jgi:DNA polymerase (family 10)
MKNAEVAAVLSTIADLLELKGELVFKVRAYQRAARAIEYLQREVEDIVKGDSEKLREISGVGEAIAEKVTELVTTGRLDYYEKLKAEFPDGLLRLMDVPGIGPKTAMRICKELDVTTIDALEKAALDGRLASLPRMGKKSADNILRHLQTYRLRAGSGRTPLGHALPVVERLLAALKECPALERIEPAGSLRRWEETVGDIDLMGTSDRPEEVIQHFTTLPFVAEVLAAGDTKGSVVLDSGLQVDLRLVPAEEFGSLMQYFTGSKEHNVLLREFALKQGLSLNEYGIREVSTGRMERFATEEAFYAQLSLPWIAPELRQGRDEIELALAGKLPTLVEAGHLMGDLHCHTEWSDGRDPIEVVARAARERGYQYLAITDHSAGRGIANGLTEERLREQHAIICSLRERVGIHLLCSSEVDIRSDGSLDFPDNVLAGMDVVVASVHSAMGQSKEKMTERIIKAIRNPHVDIIAHLTCRLLGQREPIEVDMEAVLKAAAETGTAIEINSMPERLDIRDIYVRRARELGVKLVISSDAHSITHLWGIRFGVAVARRGGCEAADILNTRPLPELLASLKGGA